MMIKKNEKPLRMKIKKGDIVEVLSGKDRGSRGKVLHVYPRLNRVVVEGVNMMTKHQKKRTTGATAGQQAGRIHMPGPMFASKVMLVCPHCDKASRVNRIRGEHDRLVRKCKKCGEIVDAT